MSYFAFSRTKGLPLKIHNSELRLLTPEVLLATHKEIQVALIQYLHITFDPWLWMMSDFYLKSFKQYISLILLYVWLSFLYYSSILFLGCDPKYFWSDREK